MNETAASGDHTKTIGGLETVVSRWATAKQPPTGKMRIAYRLLSRGAPPGKNVVSWLMNELSMSERTLRRRCEAAFGYGPKTLDRILRFHRYLELGREHAVSSAARRAAATGYADQAHLIRECRRLARCTPGEIG